MTPLIIVYTGFSFFIFTSKLFPEEVSIINLRYFFFSLFYVLFQIIKYNCIIFIFQM